MAEDRYADKSILKKFYERLKSAKQPCPVPVGAYLQIDVPLATFQANNPQYDWTGTNWLACNDDTVLRASGNTSLVGSDTGTFTEAQMPQHWHSLFRGAPTSKPFPKRSDNPSDNMNGLCMSHFAGGTQVNIICSEYKATHDGYSPVNTNCTETTSYAGSSASHSNIQKSQGCYRYKRLAA